MVMCKKLSSCFQLIASLAGRGNAEMSRLLKPHCKINVRPARYADRLRQNCQNRLSPTLKSCQAMTLAER